MAQRHPAHDDDERKPITATTPLHRHLLHDWLQHGRLTRQSFELSRADKREANKNGVDPAVSLEHGDMVSPEEAHRLRRERGKRSDGVATITGETCFKHNLAPIHDGAETLEHVSMPIPPDWPPSKQRQVARLMAHAATITVPLHHHAPDDNRE